MTQIEQLRQAAETYKEWRQVYDRRDKTSYERDIEAGLYEKFKTARDLLDLPALLADLERAERMREALEKIADPIEYLRKEAEANGARLNGNMACRIAEDANWLSGIARAALAQPSGGAK